MADGALNRLEIKALRAKLKRERAKEDKRQLVEQQVGELVRITREDEEWQPDEDDELQCHGENDDSEFEEDDCATSPTPKRQYLELGVGDELQEVNADPNCASVSTASIGEVRDNDISSVNNSSRNQEHSAVQSCEETACSLSSVSAEEDDSYHSSDEGLASEDLEDSHSSEIGLSAAAVLHENNDSFLLEATQENPDKKLSTELAKWADKHQIRSRALSSLLVILRDHGHPSLPKCSKTLLQTPRSTVGEIRDLAGGQFWYFGILEGMKNRLSLTYLNGIQNGQISIDIFTDGLSPYKSTGAQIWPIAGRLIDQKMPFVIALWCGESKEPTDLDAFWEDFINEADQLKTGFELHGNFYNLKIRNYMGDAPARNWFKRTNPHTSKICRERCTAVASYCEHRMVYEPGVGTLRTDESFRREDQPNYHRGTSPLLKLSTEMISQVPLDTMHLLYLGVMKRMLVRLFKKKQSSYTLRKTEIEEAFNLSLKILVYLPCEFKTRRGLKDLKFYKAKELSRIALYDGFLLFKSLPHSQLYHNFLLFACALRILANPTTASIFVDDAEVLLKEFVKNSQHVYGKSFIVYNVHHLEHLADDSRRHGTLEEMSCFMYENYLGKIKQLLYAPGRTLPQLVNRIKERLAVLCDEEPPPKPAFSYQQPHSSRPTLNVKGQEFNMLETPEYTFQLGGNDSYCLTKTGDVVWIRNILKAEEEGFIVGRKFKNKSNYFEDPLPSSTLDIYKVQGLEPLEKWNLRDIRTKIALIPLKPVLAAPFKGFLCL